MADETTPQAKPYNGPQRRPIGGRPRVLSVEEEAALVVMKRAGAADKVIMGRFDVGRRTIYRALERAENCANTPSTQVKAHHEGSANMLCAPELVGATTSGR